MGSRFVQVDLDFVDSKACGILAARLGIDRDAAAGKMLRAWGWALQQAIKAAENDPIRAGHVVGEEAELLLADAARWAGPAEQFREAAERAGLLETTKKGVRFKGWEERYGSLLRKWRKDAQRPDGRKGRLPKKSRENPARDSGGSGEGFPRADTDPDPESRSRDHDYDRDLEKREAEDDRSAPAATSRRPSWQQQVLVELRTSRAEKLVQLEVDPQAEENQDEELSPAFLNGSLKKIRERCGGDELAVVRLWDRYLEETWPASKSPPYPLRMFLSEKVWPQFLEPAQAEAEA